MISSLLLDLWKAFHFSSKNRYILNEIQTGYSVKTLNVIKATVTCWLFQSTSCKRTRERYPIIIKSLDDIITKNPEAELIELHDQTVCRPMQLTCPQLKQMRDNSQSPLLKSFSVYNHF